MKVAVLYRSNSEQERGILEFEQNYSRQTGRSLSLYDLNTQDGWSLAKLYDITSYPAVLAMSDDGQLLQMWQGENLPLMNEVMYYDRASQLYFLPLRAIVNMLVRRDTFWVNQMSGNQPRSIAKNG